MIHKGTKYLETERLILRKFNVNDAQKMFDNWATNSNVTKFLTWQPHANVEITKAVLNDWISKYNEDNFYQWAIVIKDKNEPIGSLSVVRINEDVNEVEIGYCIGEQWWRQGFTAEAFKRVIDFLFNEVGVKRICAKHDVNNPNSGKVMVKCGLKHEGTLKRAGKNNDNNACDLAIYSILNY